MLLYFTRRALAINLFARLTYVYMVSISTRVINIILSDLWYNLGGARFPRRRWK